MVFLILLNALKEMIARKIMKRILTSGLWSVVLVATAGPVLAQAPVNDDCSGAVTATINTNNTCTLLNSGTSTNATTSSAVSCFSGTQPAWLDIWYTFTAADVSMDITMINVFNGTPFPTNYGIQLYTGADCSSLTELGCSRWNTSFITLVPPHIMVNTTPGQVYYIKAFANRGSINWDLCLKSSSIPLPVAMSQLRVRAAGNGNELLWNTFQEQNNKGFTLQRSLDGNTFSEIATVPSLAKGGNSSQVLNYAYVDRNAPSGTVYYRLIQTDLDGKQTVSDIVKLERVQQEEPLAIAAFPNPVKGSFTLRASRITAAGATITVMDISGKKLIATKVSNTETTIPVGNLAKGMYFLKYVAPEGNGTLKLNVE